MSPEIIARVLQKLTRFLLRREMRRFPVSLKYRASTTDQDSHKTIPFLKIAATTLPVYLHRCALIDTIDMRSKCYQTKSHDIRASGT